ncbi:unnamed protein product [Alternaria alternata]
MCLEEVRSGLSAGTPVCTFQEYEVESSISVFLSIPEAPLVDFIEGDPDLTPEQLEEIETATRAKDRSYAKAYQEEKRANPTEKWKASQKARNAKAYPQTRANQVKAIEEKTYYCSVCDVASTDAAAQKIHNATPRHIRWSTKGRGSWCEPCGKGFRYPSNLAAHEKRPCHVEKVASMS